MLDANTKARFEATAMPHFDAVFRMACALSGSRVEADDLVQEAFIRGFKAFERFELREYGAKPWLLKILYNVFYTAKNKQRRQPSLLDDVDFDHFEEELVDMGGDPETAESLNWDHFDEEIKKAVESLQPEYRTVLLLWSIEGLSYKEIAEVCECPMGTIMSRLYRGRQLLGRKLRSYAQARGFSG